MQNIQTDTQSTHPNTHPVTAPKDQGRTTVFKGKPQNDNVTPAVPTEKLGTMATHTEEDAAYAKRASRGKSTRRGGGEGVGNVGKKKRVMNKCSRDMRKKAGRKRSEERADMKRTKQFEKR